MRKEKRENNIPGSTPQEERIRDISPSPRWTFWEVLGLLVSAVLVVMPLLSVAYTFIFPPGAPAGVLFPTPGSPTPTYTPGGPTTTPTATPTPTLTPTPTRTPTPGPSPTPSPPPTSGGFRVEKVANRTSAFPGETVIFTIGLSNETANQVNASVNDTLPDQFNLGNVTHNCPSGSISPSGRSFQASLTVPAGQSCQIFVSAVVASGCDCYVRNCASWSGGGSSGNACSQDVWLHEATPTPAPTTPPPPSPMTPSPPPTSTPYPTPGTPTPTPITPTPTNTPTPTWTPTPSGPTTTPTETPTPGGPTATPTETPTPGGPTATPTKTPTPTPVTAPTPRPTEEERPPRPTEQPTVVPTLCAHARIIGEACAAGVTVTISSCCPPWSARTTTDAGGRFEFAALTAGTFTVSALGRSRTVRLETCESVVRVNLCPVTAGPTSPPTVPPTALTPGVTAPTETAIPVPGVTLRLEASALQAQPGQSLVLYLTLHNGLEREALEGITVSGVFTSALGLQGAASSSGDIRLVGQKVLLTAQRLGPGQDLRLRVDAFVRPGVPAWTTLTLQGTARFDGVEIPSNILELQVVEAGALPPPAGTPLGGPEPVPLTPVPTQVPGGLGTAIPYTGSGTPIVGVALGGVVLLLRQLRLWRAARKRSNP